MSLAHAVVVAASVATPLTVPFGPGLGNEPITTATLRDAHGALHRVRILGGPNSRGGTTRLAGYVVPALGDSVRLDLRDEGAPDLKRPAWGPNTPAATWPVSSLPVSFTLAVPSRDLGGQTLAELDVALRTWSEARCTAWRARLSPASAVTPDDDGINAVYWHDASWPAELVSGALAQTVVHTDAAGNVHDTDIHLNGADHRWSLDGSTGTVDARGVLVHELGHALGLGHTTTLGATMFASNPRGTAWRSLESDDIDGVCALYPGTGSARCDASGASCPAGFVCVAGSCERVGSRGGVCSPCARVPGSCEGAGDDARCIDIGTGNLAGRVCGRACAAATDCGARFTCARTSAAGDLQCVPNDGCKGGPNPCTRDADCAGALCRGAVCVGASDPDPATFDAGLSDAAPVSPDAAVPAAELSSTGGGCSTRGACGPGQGPFVACASLLMTLMLAITRRRLRPLPPASSCRRAHRGSRPTSP